MWTCVAGLVVPLAGDEDDRGGRCNRCGREVSADELQAAVRGPLRGLQELEALGVRLARPAALADWEQFLRRQLQPRGPLHATHWIALRAKRGLAYAAGAVLGKMGRDHTTSE